MPLLWGNETLLVTIQKEFPNSTLYWLMVAIVFSIVWITYLTYYNARVFGILVTIVVNRFVRNGHVKFGSLSVSVLSGKMLFRDAHWITKDFSMRSQLGFARFRWWRPLTTKKITEDLSYSEPRLIIYLETFEWHIYNISPEYAKMESLFGLEQHIVIGAEELPPVYKSDNSLTKNPEDPAVEDRWIWRDLIPVIKCNVSDGRIIYGNHHLPTSLSVNFSDTNMVYTSKPASTPFDQFMHSLTAEVDNLRVLLVPSPGYEGLVEEPPRYMGKGFVILQSNDVDIYYYYDEPGLVPSQPETFQLADGGVISNRTFPCWGMNMKCGKMTNMSYGPWVDRQKYSIFRFMFPLTYECSTATVLPQPGEVRIYKCFDFKMSMKGDCSIDVLFSKETETQAMHLNSRAGSYIESSIPVIQEQDGITTKTSGQLMNVETTTSMQFHSLFESETLEFEIESIFPVEWNDHQIWILNLIACKTSVYLVYDLWFFINDLVVDWASKSCEDIYKFTPFTWNICLQYKQFELITLVNEYNWVDCSGQTTENAQLAICGDVLEVNCKLPFVDFLPPVINFPILIKGANLMLRLYVPEKSTSRDIVQSLASSAKIVDRGGKELPKRFGKQAHTKWCWKTEKSNDWVDCLTTPSLTVSILSKIHPVYVVPDFDMSDDAQCSSPSFRCMRQGRDFDATQMEPDVVNIHIETAPIVAYAYGSLIRAIIILQDNYAGYHTSFTDYKEDKEISKDNIAESSNKKPFDPRLYRPVEVKLEAELHDVQVHLVKHCHPTDPPCPWIYIEYVAIEQNATYSESELQVLLSPAFLLTSDKVKRPLPHTHLQDGHLKLSGLQVRSHIMYSNVGVEPAVSPLAYGWLFEVIVGDVTGRLTAPQLQMVVDAMQNMLFLVMDAENALEIPNKYKATCYHNKPQTECLSTTHNLFPCPTTDDLCYRMTRVIVEFVDISLVESGSAVSLRLHPMRLSMCNLHGTDNEAGITATIPQITIKQRILSVPITQQYNSTTDMWLEAGSMKLGPITFNAAMGLPYPRLRVIQDTFLKTHDRRTHSLSFLWPASDFTSSKLHLLAARKCACMGGCSFFGNKSIGLSVFLPNDQDCLHNLKSRVNYMVRSDETATLNSTSHSSNSQIMTRTASVQTLTQAYSSDNIMNTLDSDSLETSLPSPSISYDSTTVSIDAGPAMQRHLQKARLSSWLNGSMSRVHQNDELSLSDSEALRHNQQDTFDSPLKLGKSLTARPASLTLPRNSCMSEESEKFISCSENEYTDDNNHEPGKNGAKVLNERSDDDSTSSGMSFATAHSSNVDKKSSNRTNPEESGMHDFVNLHYQLNQPITTSAILISSYMKHMTQLTCSHWTALAPVPHLISGGMGHFDKHFLSTTTLPPPGTDCQLNHEMEVSKSKSIPQFTLARKGFSPSMMIPKCPPKLSTNANISKTNLEYDHFSKDSSATKNTDNHQTRDYGVDVESHISNTRVVVTLKGSVDVIVSPMMLEALHRFINAVTPTLEMLHVSYVVDTIHRQCCSSVLSQNKLLRESNQERDNVTKKKLLQKESKSNRIEVIFLLPKVNMCMLQASLAKEDVLVTDLDHVDERMCTSVLCGCIDSIKLVLFSNRQTEKTDTHTDNYLKTLDTASTELHREEMMGNLYFARVHLQLRRLQQQVVVTQLSIINAIPEHQSNVVFTLDDSLSIDSPTTAEVDVDERFIMFECGLEDISLKITRRYGYDTHNAGDEKVGGSPEQAKSPMKNGPTNKKGATAGNAQMIKPVLKKLPTNHMMVPIDQEASVANGSTNMTAEVLPLHGNTSGCLLEVTTVWFSFVTPPAKKVIESTGHDWNMTTTVIPAIKAWLSPTYRAVYAIKKLKKLHKRRMTALMACITTNALQMSNIHVPARSKFNKLTCVAETLQEDLSCRLMAVLRRYIAAFAIEEIELDVSTDNLPPFVTMQKGLLALVQQWNGILLETTKSQSAKLPSQHGTVNTARAFSVIAPARHFKSLMVVNEDKSLLARFRDMFRRKSSGNRYTTSFESRPQPVHTQYKRHSSVGFLVGSTLGVNLPSWLSRNSSITGDRNSSSALSGEAQTQTVSDLYLWMQQQQGKHNYSVSTRSSAALDDLLSMGTGSSFLNDDVQVAFKPILTALGLTFDPMKISTLMKYFYNTVSIQGKLDTLRVETVKAEQLVWRPGQPRTGKRGRNKGKKKMAVFHITPFPVFVFENFTVKAAMKSGLDTRKTVHIEPKNSFHETSRRQTLHKVVRPVTRKLYLDMNCDQITQNINKPLLRLIYRFFSVIDVIRSSCQELKEMPMDIQPRNVQCRSWQNLSLFSESDSEESEEHNLPRSVSQDCTFESRTIQMDANEKNVSEEARQPSCWDDLHQLLERYSMSVDQTADRQSVKSPLFVINETSDDSSSGDDYLEELERQPVLDMPASRHSIFSEIYRMPVGEHVPFTVIGVMKVRLVQVSAILGGTKLVGDLQNVTASATHKEIVRGSSKKRVKESSVNANVGFTRIDFREKKMSSKLTIVTLEVSQSHGLYSVSNRDTKENNSGVLNIGVIEIDIPQHPVALQKVVYRSSRRLSTTLSEFTKADIPVFPSDTAFDETSIISKNGSDEFSLHVGIRTKPSVDLKIPLHLQQNTHSSKTVVHFIVILNGFNIHAALLPSLKSSYKIGEVRSSGTAGPKTSVKIDMEQHSISFTSTVAMPDHLQNAAAIDLPSVHISGYYYPQDINSNQILNATAVIGIFKRKLTTSLLNHLISIQKVFMKEINEVVQKMTDQPRPLFSEWSSKKSPNVTAYSVAKSLSYLVEFKFTGIQITAMTPTQIAVRLKTSAINITLTNGKTSGLTALSTSQDDGNDSQRNQRLLVSVQLDIGLVLGTILREATTEEDCYLQHLASFDTLVALRHGEPDVFNAAKNTGEKTLMVTLHHPIIYVQPGAVDKAILVWFNYKTTYEYWNEQMQDALPLGSRALTATPVTNKLFLEVKAIDMGICLPLKSSSGLPISRNDPTAVAVMTLESTEISVCSSGTIVSKGQFVGLCMRFADDFQVSQDDWRPNIDDTTVMNAMVVPNGTYEICSRTVGMSTGENIVWVLNINWQMQGLNIHLDTNIGQQVSALGSTLTSFMPEENDDQTSDTILHEAECNIVKSQLSKPSFYDACMKVKQGIVGLNTREIVDAMNKQSRKVADMKLIGAPNATIVVEESRLTTLEMALFRDFRNNIAKKLNRQIIHTTPHDEGTRSINMHFRSKSVDTGWAGESSPAESITEQSAQHQGEKRQSLSDRNVPPLRQSSLNSDEYKSSFVTNLSPEMLPILDRRMHSSVHTSESADNTHGRTIVRPHVVQSVEETYIFQDSSYLPSQPTIRIDRRITTSAEPKVYLEIDVKVNVDCGKCVLYPKEQDANSRRNECLKNIITNTPRTTVFILPGVDVWVRYSSKPKNDDDPDDTKMKKSYLYTWLTLQHISEEMLVGPVLLEFLEQALEPTPLAQLPTVPSCIELDAAPTSIVDTYGSFPVEIIIYVQVQTIEIQFMCLPMSRVQCLLHLPSLDLVFSTKKTTNIIGDDSILQPGASGGARPKTHSSQHSHSSYADTASAGGITVTACLTDFSMSIFHPYGGLTRRTSTAPSVKKLHKMVGNTQAADGQTGDTFSRNDALSMNVEFIKLNIMRSHANVDNGHQDHNVDNGHQDHTASSGMEDTGKQSGNIVHVSAICDIGLTSFTYDMRRLSEILAFPKTWYSPSLMRHMFTGKIKTAEPDSTSGCSSRRHSLPRFASKIHWETFVIYMVNLSKLNVTVNMSNIMGHARWMTTDIRSQGNVSVHSKGFKNMTMLSGYKDSELEAHGGIVGCKIQTQNFWINMMIKEDPSMQPHHRVGMQLEIMEAGIQYMGSNILVGRMCNLDVVLQDEWRPQHGHEHEEVYGGDQSPRTSTQRPFLILVHADMSWNQLHLMISRSTTPDLVRIAAKLDEFGEIHIRKGARLFGPTVMVKTKSTDIMKEWMSSIRHHRHWQTVYRHVSGCKLSMFDFIIPRYNSILGGTMTLHGNRFKLVCFHGTNFRSKLWALFTLDEPTVHFETKVWQSAPVSEDEASTNIIQKLTFQLGHDLEGREGTSKPMATVCQVNRGHHVTPHFNTVHDWFHYALSTSEIKVLQNFPKMQHGEDVPPSFPVDASKHKYSHNTEIIFMVPALKMRVKTVHHQGPNKPTTNECNPVVHCSFHTEFNDHLYISMDAEIILFIHDLITGYMNEGDTGPDATAKAANQSPTVASPAEMLKLDCREFYCDSWHLEPTIRLISLGGKKIEPVGVDYILQKLGFQHARLTIPKWIQRGNMDQLDYVMSVLTKRLLSVLEEDKFYPSRLHE